MGRFRFCEGKAFSFFLFSQLCQEVAIASSGGKDLRLLPLPPLLGVSCFDCSSLLGFAVGLGNFAPPPWCFRSVSEAFFFCARIFNGSFLFLVTYLQLVEIRV